MASSKTIIYLHIFVHSSTFMTNPLIFEVSGRLIFFQFGFFCNRPILESILTGQKEVRSTDNEINTSDFVPVTAVFVYQESLESRLSRYYKVIK